MKKRITKQGLLGLCMVLMFGMSLAASRPAQADPRQDAALELLLTMKLAKTLNDAMNQALENQIRLFPAMAAYRPTVEAFLKKYMGWEVLKHDFVKIYSAEFTEKELRDMITFYKTPTGQKAVEKIPIVMAKGTMLGLQRVQQNMAELNQMIKAEQEKNKNK